MKLRLWMQMIFAFSIVLSVFMVYYMKKTGSNPSAVHQMMQHNKPDKLQKEYYPDGNVSAEGLLLHHAKTGKWTYYHPDGKVARYVWYNNGVPAREEVLTTKPR